MAAQKKSAPRKVGRPTKYTPELAEKICDLIREGLSEREICSQKGMPDASTLGRWKDNNQEFCNQSARARGTGVNAQPIPLRTSEDFR